MNATDKEKSVCKEIVEKEIQERKLENLAEKLDKIVEAVLNITYSKGGDYSASTLQAFAETYFEFEMYKKLD